MSVVFRPVGVVHEPVYALTHHLVGGIAEDVSGGPIERPDDPEPVRDHDSIDRGLDDRAVTFGAFLNVTPMRAARSRSIVGETFAKSEVMVSPFALSPPSELFELHVRITSDRTES